MVHHPKRKFVDLLKDANAWYDAADEHLDKITDDCDKCDFVHKQKYDVKIHTESVHRGIRYDCKLCLYKSKHKSALRKHVK